MDVLWSTVDGSEIPRPQVDMVNILIIYKVLYISGGCLGFLNHQQYQYQISKNKYFYLISNKNLGGSFKLFLNVHPDPWGNDSQFDKQAFFKWDETTN